MVETCNLMIFFSNLADSTFFKFLLLKIDGDIPLVDFSISINNFVNSSIEKFLLDRFSSNEE